MRSLALRQRMVRAAAVAASLVLVTAACSTPSTSGNPGDGSGSLGALALTQGALLLSDGTKVVTIGDQKVTFPTTVTDAAWSPDGSRLAFVDGDGNIATARPDGSGLVVLTKATSGVTRSRPSWSRAWLFYAEQKADGTSALKSVPTNGCDGTQEVTGKDWSMDTGDGTSYVDLAPSASIGTRPSRVAFQHNEPSGPEIWINDTNQRTPLTEKLVAGSEPALLPDGKKLAYVGANGQVFVLDLANLSNVGTGQQITRGADHPTRLTWTPDGQHVAYRTPAGVKSVGLSGNDPETSVAATIAVPAFLGGPRDSVGRVTGADPIALSIAATQARWPSVSAFLLAQGYQGAWNAILATPDQAAALADVQGARPLLLTAGDALDPRTKAELQRMFGKVDKDRGGQPQIFLVGNAISPAVAGAVEAMGYQVTRGPLTDTPAPAAGSATCAPEGGADLFRQTLVVVDGGAAMDTAIATSLADDWNAPIIRIDPKAGLTDQVKAYLARSSGAIESVLLVDSAGTIPADLEKQIGELVSGPLGYTTVSKPSVPALTYPA
jgi:Tol biopolymer transport system component